MQESLFKPDRKKMPLSERMRPRTLDEFVGQEHVLGKGKLLRRLIESDKLSSMVLWGPPGTGKTTLAMVIAETTKADFVKFSAVISGIKEVKQVLDTASERFKMGKRTVVFVDGIHHFNKSQQDAFLPYVEQGAVILICATTENPSFEIISPLLSRSTVVPLKALSVEDLITILHRALSDAERGLGAENVVVTEEQLRKIAVYANGDARTALNTLELAVMGAEPDKQGRKVLTDELINEALMHKALLYDKTGEEHYNIISALHKSMRNSDPDAAIYWLARMLEAGEDPLYVARRLIRFASEDVGMADPIALLVAVAAYEASHYIGMPECSVNLAEAVVYLSLAPKSNSLYVGYEKAKADAMETIAEPVPFHLRNAPTQLMRELGYGKGYKYAHDFEEKVADMECLPENLRGRVYYLPTDQGREKQFAERLKEIREKKGRK
ncbi:replication-associated recombination protein A [Coprothermobacteraceae bacterium]|nr:replication-associated recombination protein A [Coprothermobacteraceae bacterium]